MRSRILRVAALVVVVGVLVLLAVRPRSPFRHRLVLKAYFTDAQGLRAGAPVRLAGVDVGTVTSVRARPEMKDAPAEVIMTLDPPYDFRIPDDSLVSVETDGMLGPAFVEIEVKGASGPPARPNAVLKAIPTEHLTTDELLEKLSQAMGKRSCDCGTQTDDAASPAGKKKPQSSPSH